MARKSKSIRAYTFAFMLYLDNYEQMRLFDWLKSGYLDCKSLYILHQPESDEKKPHYHVMVTFDTKRTAKGVRNYFGVARTVWRKAHMTLNEDVTQKLVKRSKDDPETETGYIRKETWKDKETYVLSNPDDPQSYIEVEYHEGDKVCREPLQDDEIWRLCPVYVVPHVEEVSDRCSYADYILHQTPQAIMDGKRRYTRDEIKGDMDFIESCFPVKKKECTSNLISDIYLIAQNCPDHQRFMEMCLRLNRSDIIEYVASHSYFVEKFLFPRAVKCFTKRGETYLYE